MENKLEVTVKNLLSQDNVKKRFHEILGDKSAGFISSVLNVTKTNSELSKANPHTVLNAAVVAATLDLPIDPNLGFAAIVPYNNTKKDGTKEIVAQFQMMYKGFVQLAQRSGQYRTINVSEIYEGEFVSENRLTGEYVFDFTAKKSDKIIGYVAYFALINGFQKAMYWSIEKIDKHGKRYSKVYGYGKGLWADKTKGGFEAMCQKTVLKALLSKFGPLTVDYQTAKAVKYDQAVINDEQANDITYVDATGDDHDGDEVTDSQVAPNPAVGSENGKLPLK